MKPPCLLLCALAVWLVASGVALAADGETVGQVMTLPARPGPHWFWLSDILLHRTALFDADTGGMLGQISSGTAGVGFVIAPLFAPDHREIYLAETYYARGVRGTRTDVVTVYDAATLRPLGDEIQIPAERAEYFPGVAANALSDDGRFMAVFNLTPRTSVSIVDVKVRRFTAHVETPGCSLVYAAGARRFLMLCANGAALSVLLDDEGGTARLERSEPFFDPQKDPVTEKAVRRGSEWLFVSFEGVVHPVDVSGEKPRFGETWSLVDDADRRASWRLGGRQHAAAHRHRPRCHDGRRAARGLRAGPRRQPALHPLAWIPSSTSRCGRRSRCSSSSPRATSCATLTASGRRSPSIASCPRGSCRSPRPSWSRWRWPRPARSSCRARGRPASSPPRPSSSATAPRSRSTWRAAAGTSTAAAPGPPSAGRSAARWSRATRRWRRSRSP